jgi:hypothetical protein
MKGLLPSIRRIGVAVLAFLIGVAVFVAWRNSGVKPYCEVARHGEWYHNTVVRVRATLLFGSGGIYIYEDCDPVEALATLVELDGANDSDTSGFVEELLVQREDSALQTRSSPLNKVDVIIEGRFNARFTKGCWGPKYHLAAKKIELLSPVTEYIPPNVGEPGLRLKH